MALYQGPVLPGSEVRETNVKSRGLRVMENPPLRGTMDVLGLLESLYGGTLEIQYGYSGFKDGGDQRAGAKG